MYLPVNCAIIAQVYKDIRRMGQDLMPKTMTQLYTTLIRVLIRRHMIKIERWDKESKVPIDFNHLPEDIYADLQRVSELAYNGLFKKDVQLVFTDDDIIAERFNHLGLMDEVKEMYVCEGASTSYSFLHLSIQEFLAAWHVSIHPELSHMICSSICDSYTIPPHLVMFVRFLFGVVRPIASEMNTLLAVGKSMDTDEHIEQLFHCLYEAQNPEIVSMLIKSCYPLALDNPFDLYVFGYILVHSPISWVVNITPSLEILISGLEDHTNSDHKILGSISKLSVGEQFELNNLPPLCVIEHMTSISIMDLLNSSIPVFSEGISTLSDLKEVISKYKEPCEDDYLLYQSLKSLTS